MFFTSDTCATDVSAGANPQDLASLVALVETAIAQSAVLVRNGWAFHLPVPAPEELDADLCFTFPEHPNLDLRMRFECASVIVEAGRGEPQDTVSGSVGAFLDFFENNRSAQALFLEREWQLGNEAGCGEGDLDEIRDYLRELENLLPAPYELINETRDRVRASAVRLGRRFGIDRRSNVTPAMFLEEFVRTGTPVVLQRAATVDWWSFGRLQEMFRGVYTHLSRYPNCSYAIDDCIEKIVSGHSNAFKAALPLTNAIRFHHCTENLFPAQSVFQKAQALMIAPADQHMGASYRATSWHRDWADNLLTEMIGHKRVRLASPLDEDLFMLQTTPACHYNVAVDHSPLDPKNKQACEGMTVCDVVLEPGDLLFIPCGWLHTVENLTATAAINCWRVYPQELLDV